MGSRRFGVGLPAGAPDYSAAVRTTSLTLRMRHVYSALVADTHQTSTSQPHRRRKPSEWTHNISVRLNDDQFVVAEALRATFDPPTHTEALRWLLESAEGKDLIGRRVRGEI